MFQTRVRPFEKTTCPKNVLELSKRFKHKSNHFSKFQSKFQTIPQEHFQTFKHYSKTVKTFINKRPQTFSETFQTFKQYETLSTKNTVSKVQNTQPNTFHNFQNIFHFPKHHSNTTKPTRTQSCLSHRSSTEQSTNGLNFI